MKSNLVDSILNTIWDEGKVPMISFAIGHPDVIGPYDKAHFNPGDEVVLNMSATAIRGYHTKPGHYIEFETSSKGEAHRYVIPYDSIGGICVKDDLTTLIQLQIKLPEKPKTHEEEVVSGKNPFANPDWAAKALVI